VDRFSVEKRELDIVGQVELERGPGAMSESLHVASTDQAEK